MRRFLAVLLGVALALVALIFLITRGGEVASIVQRGQGIIALILALLQLVGIALALALAVFVLVQYARYVRPNRFVFEGFSNAPKLIEGVRMPLDLNILAREKLIYQFKLLNSEWEMLSDVASSDADALVTDGLYFGETSQKQDNKKYVPTELMKNSEVLKDLKEVISAVKDAEGINLMAFAEEIAPKEVTPIMKFVEAVVPPHIIRATGHLQWRSDELGKAGITFEFVDLASQRNLMVRTIWWRSLETKAHGTKPDAQPPSGWSLDDVAANEARAKQKLGDDEIALATDRYIELLGPTMYWLALMFWKQKMVANTPILNYFRRGRERRRQAQLLYLFGALYYACSQQFEAYSIFFRQLAIEQFRQASTVDSKWCLPLLYLANLYSFKMQKSEGETRKKLLEAAIDLYEKAYKRAESLKRDKYTKHRVIIAKALAEVTSDDSAYIGAAIKEVEKSKKEMDPACFDPRRVDCPDYLYNLALWYAFAAKWLPIYDLQYALDATRNARRYVVYCLSRSEDLWDTVSNEKLFQGICREEGLNALKAALKAKQEEGIRLAELRDNDFKLVTDDILKEISKEVNGWVVDEV